MAMSHEVPGHGPSTSAPADDVGTIPIFSLKILPGPGEGSTVTLYAPIDAEDTEAVAAFIDRILRAYQERTAVLKHFVSLAEDLLYR